MAALFSPVRQLGRPDRLWTCSRPGRQHRHWNADTALRHDFFHASRRLGGIQLTVIRRWLGCGPGWRNTLPAAYIVGMTLEELFGFDADDEIYAGFPYLLIEIDGELLCAAGLPLNEARSWRPSSVKGLMYRIDPADEKLNQKRHVHVAASKHTAAKGKQVSWNDDGGRHDRHSFNAKLGTRVNYRDAARAALNLPGEFILESIEPPEAEELIHLSESLLGNAPRDRPLKLRAFVSSSYLSTDNVRLGLPD